MNRDRSFTVPLTSAVVDAPKFVRSMPKPRFGDEHDTIEVVTVAPLLGILAMGVQRRAVCSCGFSRSHRVRRVSVAARRPAAVRVDPPFLRPSGHDLPYSIEAFPPPLFSRSVPTRLATTTQVFMRPPPWLGPPVHRPLTRHRRTQLGNMQAAWVRPRPDCHGVLGRSNAGPGFSCRSRHATSQPCSRRRPHPAAHRSQRPRVT